MNKTNCNKRDTIYALIFAATLTILYALIFILSEFSDSPYKTLKDFAILTFQWSAITTGTFGLIYMLSISKYIFALTFPLLTVFSTVLTYFRYTANATLTPMTIDLALINDAKTNAEVISWELITLMILSFAVSIAIVSIRWKKIRFPRPWIHLLISLTLIYATTSMIPQLSRPLTQRMPYSIYYNFKLYFENKVIAAEQRDTFTSEAISNNDSITIVFLIGESLRSDHLQINGYNRETTPLLAKEENLISLPNIYSEECFTHLSVPHIMTRADSINPERAYNEQSFITIFKKAGFYTSWIANQEPTDTYVYFMNESDTLIYASSSKSMYTFDKWVDDALLPHLEEELKNKNTQQLHILHTIGSHWWYNSHYTDDFEKFTPVISSRVISSNSKEEMINSYDNTILYTDNFIKQVIDKIRDRNAILLYLSDHGECLGEEGYFTHGTERPELHYPAAFIWYSDTYKNMYSEKIENLEKNHNKCYHTDYLFHSIIDAADITSEYTNPQLSIFKHQ